LCPAPKGAVHAPATDAVATIFYRLTRVGVLPVMKCAYGTIHSWEPAIRGVKAC